ncbi:hypothetical protein QF041_001565 [Paenibacillus sp. W2I17]|nr:hypothetical protein [Paenibacillus sp. W2I17]
MNMYVMKKGVAVKYHRNFFDRLMVPGINLVQ